MYTKALSTTSNAQQYYFQIRLKQLRSKLNLSKKLRFSIYKGMQKVDSTKQDINFNGKKIILPDIPLNFYVPSYNPKKSIEFTVYLLEITEQGQKDLGQFTISTNNYILSFIQSEDNFNYPCEDKLTDQIELQYNLYINRSRLSMINSIKKLESQKNMSSQANLQSNQKQIPFRKSFQKNQQRMETPKVKQQFSRTATLTKNIESIQVSSQQPRQLSQTSKKKVLRRTGNNSRSNLVTIEDRKKAQSVKSEILQSPQQKMKNSGLKQQQSAKKNNIIQVEEKIDVSSRSQMKLKQSQRPASQISSRKKEKKQQEIVQIKKKDSTKQISVKQVIKPQSITKIEKKETKRQVENNKQQQKGKQKQIKGNGSSWIIKLLIAMVLIGGGVYYFGFYQTKKGNKKKGKKNKKNDNK